MFQDARYAKNFCSEPKASVSHETFRAWYCQCELRLSKVMDGANQAAFLEMHQVIKYLIDTKSIGLKLELKGSKKEPGTLYVSAIVTMQKIQSQEEV